MSDIDVIARDAIANVLGLIRRCFNRYVLRMVEENPVLAPATPELAPPWARLIGRTFDVSLTISILTLVIDCLIEIAHSPIKGVWLNYRQYLSLVFLPFALVIDALVISLFGTTLGKSLVGVKLVAQDGEWLSFQRAMLRNFRLYLFGYGLGLPLFSLYTMYLSYRNLYRDGILGWDKSANTQIYGVGASFWRNIVCIFVNIIVILAINSVEASVNA